MDGATGEGVGVQCLPLFGACRAQGRQGVQSNIYIGLIPQKCHKWRHKQKQFSACSARSIVLYATGTLKIVKGKRYIDLYSAHREKLTSEALRYGSHSFYTANTP